MNKHICGSIEFETELKRACDMFVQVVRFKEPVGIISSSFYNGGIRETTALVIAGVPKDYDCADPVKDAESILSELELPEDTVFFMTAAEVEYVFNVVDEDFNGTEASAIVTAGLSNQVVAGDTLDNWQERHALSNERSEKLRKTGKFHVGTINTIAVSSLPLSVPGMVNAMIAVTEAKTAAMNVMGYNETGTTSDAIAIVVPEIGNIDYAGTGMDIGIATARAIKTAVCRALIIRDDFPVGTSEDVKDRIKAQYMP
ncbi:MAG: hypothetical protein E7Z66_05835 [Thermoplasmata archaeon]|nr:hypothetical protein [Thermoplasmata archaeon]